MDKKICFVHFVSLVKTLKNGTIFFPEKSVAEAYGKILRPLFSFFFPGNAAGSLSPLFFSLFLFESPLGGCWYVFLCPIFRHFLQLRLARKFAFVLRFFHHFFLCSSMETPPGPRDTTINRPPITERVCKEMVENIKILLYFNLFLQF